MTVDTINKDLSVVGFNNTVTYKNGDPKVNDLGSGNTVKKG
jgi:TolB-like protein